MFGLKRLHGLAVIFDGLSYLVAGRSAALGVKTGKMIARKRWRDSITEDSLRG